MRLATVAAACLLFATPAMAQDKATIEKLNDEFIAAFIKGGFSAVSDLYTEDTTVLPNGGTMVKGRPGIQASGRRRGKTLDALSLPQWT